MRNRLNKLFWFTDPKALSFKQDKHLIIHQTLAYGTIDDVRFLLRKYPRNTVKNIFLEGKQGLYDPRVVAFCQTLFGIKKLNYRKYVKQIRGAA